MSTSGLANAMGTSESPIPGPISTISCALPAEHRFEVEDHAGRDRGTCPRPRHRQHEPVIVVFPRPPLLRSHPGTAADEGRDLAPRPGGFGRPQLEMSFVLKRAQAASQKATAYTAAVIRPRCRSPVVTGSRSRSPNESHQWVSNQGCSQSSWRSSRG